MYLSISNALADIPVTLADASTLTGTKLDAAGKFAQKPQLPARIMLPAGAVRGDAMTNLEYVAWDQRRNITWRVGELYLHRFASNGLPLESVWPELVTFMDNYITAVITQRYLASIAEVMNVSPRAITVEWPSKSKRYYHAVELVTTVVEQVC